MISHKFKDLDHQSDTIIISNSMPLFYNISPMVYGANAKCTSHMVSSSTSYNDVQRMPAVAPISPCASEVSTTSSSAATSAPAICITGKFSNIEHKYYIDPRVLGTGNHGSVRECINRKTGQRYAVKSIRKSDPAVKPGGLAREILLLNEMKHQSIVQLVDIYEEADYVHLVTDLYEGGELFDKIVDKSSSGDDNNDVPCFAEDEAARIIHQILTAVFYMHDRDIVHRDIKPENILFETADKDSHIKIIDFGLSRKHRSGLEAPMTTIVGTPYYIAPEILRRRYDKSCDIWSVGVIAYTMLCGYPPFNGANNNQTHRSVLRGRYNFPVDEWKNISSEAMDFIQCMLQMDPRMRMTAEQALNHPWIVKHCVVNKRMMDEGWQDNSSVEVVYHQSSSKQLSMHGSSTIMGSPTRSPPRKVRMSMFGL